MCGRWPMCRLVWLPVGGALIFIIAAGWGPGGIELVIRPTAVDEPLLVIPLEPNERFTLRYIHSVDRTPIWEEHSVDGTGRIFLEEERFVMFGAGMGHWAGHGTLTRRGAYQVIENIHEPIGDFVLRVGSEGVDHTLMWRGRQVNLSCLAPGQALMVSARPVRFWRCLWAWRRASGEGRLGTADLCRQG